MIQNDKVVSIEYEVFDKATGELIDSNVNAMSLEFISGKGDIIPGLEKEILKLDVGKSAQIVVPPKEAYGDFDESAVEEVPIEQFAGIDLERGMTLYAQSEEGETMQVTVKDFNDSVVFIDFNHPLAGKELLFNVTVLNVRDLTPQEKLSGEIESNDQFGIEGGSCCAY